MRRKLTIAAVVLALLGVLIGVAVMFGPRLVQDKIEAELKAKLDARGIKADWGEFEAHGGRSFRLTNMHVQAPAYGLDFKSDLVEVGVSLQSVWSGEITLTEVNVSPTTVEIDLDAMLLREDEEGESQPSAAGDGGESRVDQMIRHMLENPPAVELTDTNVLVRKGDQHLLRVSSPLVSVEESWGDFVIDFEGEAQLLAEQLPELARAPIPWKVHGKLVPDEGSFEYSVTAPQENTPLVRIDVPELLGLEVGRVWGAGTVAERTAALNVDGIELVLGPGEVAAVLARAPKASISRQTNGRPRVDVHKPSVYVAPKQRRVIMQALSKLRGGSEEASEQKEAPRRKSRGVFSRIARLASQTDFVLEALSVGIHLEDDAGDLQTLTLLERLDTRIRDGLMRTTGTTAGGKFFAEAEVLPGQSWPHYLVARIEDVQLEKIPGLSTERTSLPSRGTSGRVGGVLNMNLALTMPSQGMDGPLGQSAGVGEFSVDLRGGRFDLTGVSEEPIEGVDGSAEFAFTFEPQISLITLVSGDATYGPMHVTMAGKVTDFPLDTTVIFDWQMDEIECQAIFDSIPKALLGPYSNVVLEGSLAPKGWVKFPIYSPKGMRSKFEDYEDLCETKALNAKREAWPDIEVLPRAPTGPHKYVSKIPRRPANRHDDVYWLDRPFKKRVIEGVSDPENVEVYVGPGLSTYVPLEQLPGYVYGVMYLSEQIDFFVDGPVSESLVKKALRLNLRKGRFVYGGSTVTQQLVKNLFLTRDKTFARKIQEAFIAWRIDDAITKERVLELYLNCIEFAPDVYGIGPAAWHYFEKDARDLTAAEAVFLAMLKPSPWYGEKLVQRGRTPSQSYWVDRVDQLFDRLVEHEYLTKAQAKAEKPYTLEWDDEGRYKDRNQAIKIPLLDWGAP